MSVAWGGVGSIEGPGKIPRVPGKYQLKNSMLIFIIRSRILKCANWGPSYFIFSEYNYGSQRLCVNRLAEMNSFKLHYFLY